MTSFSVPALPTLSAITEGHYYKKQLGCTSATLAWSHRSRFETAIGLLSDPDARVLDYGCGDGTFLALASERIKSGVGVDISREQIDDCRIRLQEFGNLQFFTVDELGTEASHSFDTIFCMETLEHCTEPAADAVLRDLTRLIAPTGTIIISVPIETGLMFVAKTLIRRYAAARGLSEYRFYERYDFRDALQMIFARSTTTFDRPSYGDESAPYHSHFKFNWRSIRGKLAEVFEIQATKFSPLGSLRGFASSQVWFVCTPRQR
jgi:SAM-dependent methyltransferase